ncbi:MAG: ATP-dependent DNA helicase RecG [Pseudoscardovia radai]|nr:ATP-dependent DNA helicase RecG [Pseudoscardovia radai]
MRVTLDTEVSSLMSNKRRASALKSLGVVTVRDALEYFPFRVTPAVRVGSIADIRVGEKVAFPAIVQRFAVYPMSRGGSRALVTVADSGLPGVRRGGTATLVFFSYKRHYIDWLHGRLQEGALIVVSGDASEYNGVVQFTHPQVMVVEHHDSSALIPDIPVSPSSRSSASAPHADAPSVEAALARVSRPQPVYHASSRISSQHIHDAILAILQMLDMQGAQDGAVHDATASVAAQSATQSASARDAAESIAPPEPTVVDPARIAAQIPDIVPDDLRQERGLMHRAEAFCAIHNPSTPEEFAQGIATLRYEEAFVSQTAMLRERADSHTHRAYPCAAPEVGGGAALAEGGAGSSAPAEPSAPSAPAGLLHAYIGSLPFELTQGQKDVIAQITDDMSRDWPMQRLVQGEVGSGKTVVAIAAMLRAVECGYQAVLIAPTQVLAEQHYESIRRQVGGLPEAEGLPIMLLTGGLKLAQRRKVLATAASGESCIVVATHAAFSKSFQAPNLALVVIDEQHRFGVDQRQALFEGDGPVPHMLVMTATPIPRTAAMTWFGNLDISWLTELPGGRKPITSVVVNEADSSTMGQMFVHIRKRLDKGERAYVVCARIDEDDADSFDEGYDAAPVAPEADLDGDGVPDDAQPAPPLHSVEQMSQRLAALPQFRGVAFATLTGRDDDETKHDVMERFSSGQVQVLVATTVIEVGVDVPQATNIVIFDAEHYGLSQLHQLRGRVGRGGMKSWAFFVTRAAEGSLGAERLEVIRSSTDGAEIARADLELRGAGDVLGDVQSGKRSSLKLLRVVADADVIEQARADAQAVVEKDPTLRGNVQLAGAVLDFMRSTEADAA